MSQTILKYFDKNGKVLISSVRDHGQLNQRFRKVKKNHAINHAIRYKVRQTVARRSEIFSNNTILCVMYKAMLRDVLCAYKCKIIKFP